MKNTVIKGDYKNWYLSIHKEMDKLILEGINDNIEISNNTIIDYDIKYTYKNYYRSFAYWTNWNISRIYSQ